VPENKELEVNNVEETKTLYRSKSRRLPTLTKKEKKELGVGKDEGRATLKYVRISSRKVRIVNNLIKNKGVAEAKAILRNTPKAASPILLKLLNSAEANAVNNNELNADNLYVAEIYANQGPTLKRIRARAQGRASRINKRTSHITIVLKERE